MNRDDKRLPTEQSRMNADIERERQKANPSADELNDPDAVWANGETTPPRNRDVPERPGGGDRVADAGDVGQGATSPYSLETQADNVARQTKRPR